MARVSAVIVAACMVVICASFGVALYLVFGMAPTAALVGGIAALTGLALCSIVARGRSGTVKSTQMQDLSRGVADLARQVIELGRRVAAMETKVADAVAHAEAAVAGTEPLTSEIGEIGSLIKQLAEQVNAHDLALQTRSIPRREPPAGDSGRDRATTGPAAPRLATVSPTPKPVPAQRERIGGAGQCWVYRPRPRCCGRRRPRRHRGQSSRVLSASDRDAAAAQGTLLRSARAGANRRRTNSSPRVNSCRQRPLPV